MKNNFLIACAVIVMMSFAFGTIEKPFVNAQKENFNIRIDDSSFTRQNLQTGETIPNIQIPIIIESLGPALIIIFIIVYAVKKKRKKIENKENDNS